jgi:hypothetical protein
MRIAVVIAIAVAVAAAGGFAFGQASGQSIRGIKLPIEFPAVGNIDAVKQWRLARIEEIRRHPNSPDLELRLRLANGRTVEVIGPHEPLAALGRGCGWVTTETQTVAGRDSYVERMIAFDADQNSRIIAIASLEPFNRDRTRLRRVFSR